MHLDGLDEHSERTTPADSLSRQTRTGDYWPSYDIDDTDACVVTTVLIVTCLRRFLGQNVVSGGPQSTVSGLSSSGRRLDDVVPSAIDWRLQRLSRCRRFHHFTAGSFIAAAAVAVRLLSHQQRRRHPLSDCSFTFIIIKRFHLLTHFNCGLNSFDLPLVCGGHSERKRTCRHAWPLHWTRKWPAFRNRNVFWSVRRPRLSEHVSTYFSHLNSRISSSIILISALFCCTTSNTSDRLALSLNRFITPLGWLSSQEL